MAPTPLPPGVWLVKGQGREHGFQEQGLGSPIWEHGKALGEKEVCLADWPRGCLGLTQTQI